MYSILTITIKATGNKVIVPVKAENGKIVFQSLIDIPSIIGIIVGSITTMTVVTSIVTIIIIISYIATAATVIVLIVALLRIFPVAVLAELGERDSTATASATGTVNVIAKEPP